MPPAASSPHPVTSGSAPSRDGTRIGWLEVGQGPALVVLHGGGRAATYYLPLAQALADRFRVVVPDRRGRGQTPAPAARLDVLIDDVAAVVEATGAERLFGHSGGGVVALEAALRLPIRQLALYEPPLVSALRLDWLPAFEAALAADRPGRAMALFMRGLELGPPSWVPMWLLELLLGLLVRTRAGRDMAALLHTMPPEVRALRGVTADAFAALRCPTLLLTGDRTPPALLRAVDALIRSIPDLRRQVLPGVSHNGPDVEAPAAVAAVLGAFFAGGGAAASGARARAVAT